jgi:hypothetical protein
MRPIAARFGDGYFSSVLVYLLRKGPFANHSALAETLGSIHEYEAAGGSRLDCEELIDHELGVAAQELMGLYADRTVAEDILAGAIDRLGFPGASEDDTPARDAPAELPRAILLQSPKRLFRFWTARRKRP